MTTEPLKIHKPGKPTVGPRVGKPRRKPKAKPIVEGGSGRVSTNSIGKATSEAGTKPFGRVITRQVYRMTSGPDVMGGQADD